MAGSDTFQHMRFLSLSGRASHFSVYETTDRFWFLFLEVYPLPSVDSHYLST